MSLFRGRLLNNQDVPDIEREHHDQPPPPHQKKTVILFENMIKYNNIFYIKVVVL
jgi:hypothetical protein